MFTVAASRFPWIYDVTGAVQLMMMMNRQMDTLWKVLDLLSKMSGSDPTRFSLIQGLININEFGKIIKAF